MVFSQLCFRFFKQSTKVVVTDRREFIVPLDAVKAAAVDKPIGFLYQFFSNSFEREIGATVRGIAADVYPGNVLAGRQSCVHTLK